MEGIKNPSEQRGPGEQGKIAAFLGFIAHPAETIGNFFAGGENNGEITVPGDGDSIVTDCNRPCPPEIKPPK